MEFCTQLGIKSVDIAMSHRGRLNVITCAAQSEPRNIFSELEQTNPDLYTNNKNVYDYSGDVPIHQSASNLVEFKNGKKLLVDIAPNSCHLESIDPVLLGSVRAKLDQGNKPTEEILPIIIHGDASITG